MKLARPLRTILSSLVLTVLLVSMAPAHPGHDHSDLPSVIRHPFASLDHLAITGAVLVMAGGVLLLAATHFVALRRVRWVGTSLVAAGVALALA